MLIAGAAAAEDASGTPLRNMLTRVVFVALLM